MSEVKKLKIGNTSYDIVDSSAAHALTDIAIAGSNIEFLRDIQDNYSVQGSLTINNGVASGFSTSNYIYKNDIWNTIVLAGSFTFQSKFKVTERSPSNLLVYNYASSSNWFFINCCNMFGQVAVNINGTYYSSASDLVVTNTDYWIRFTYDSTTPSILVELSTDGSTFNPVISQSSVGTIGLIGSPVRIGTYPNNSGFKGSIDLVETSFVDSNGNPLWKLVGLQSDKLIVNAAGGTVDQTYNSSSANAQSGVAIAGAGFLQNLGSYNYELLLKSPDNNTRLNASNALVEATGYRVNIGNGNTNSQNYGLSIGTDCTVQDHGIAIGWYARTNYTNAYDAIAIGSSSSSSSPVSASGDRSIAIGYQAQATSGRALAVGSGAHATGNYSSAYGAGAYATGASNIQLGLGTNSTDNSLSVGFYNNNSPVNYQLLDSSGNIPGPRMALQGAAAPDTSTVGSVGQFYVDTTNQDAYICVSDASSTYTWKKITP